MGGCDVCMKNQFKEELWQPVVTEHPKPSVGFRKHKTHIYSRWQPPSERYEVPGLMPKVPREKEEKPLPFLAEPTDDV